MTPDTYDDEPTDAASASSQDDDGNTSMTYEQARDELVSVVQQLENGGVSLQESVALWERGEKLATICQRSLDGARQRLDAAIGKNAD